MPLNPNQASNGKLSVSSDLILEVSDVIGKCIGILGIRGSGKTNTAAVIVEELLSIGIPVVIVDIDGEYWSLKEKYEIIRLGKGDVDIGIEPQHGRIVAKFSLKKGISIILDLSNYSHSEITQLLLSFFKGLWVTSASIRRPYFIILEEAHEFVPQNSNSELKEILVKIALRGRKRGLGLILVSQRSAKVDKDVLTQAEILLLHKVIHPADLKVYHEILPLSIVELRRMVHELEVGQCIFYNGDKLRAVKIRPRTTFHAGTTPPLDISSKHSTLRGISQELADEIRKEVLKAKKDDEDIIDKLRREKEELMTELMQKDKEIEKLKQQIELLSKLKVVLPSAQVLLENTMGVRRPAETTVNEKFIREVRRVLDRLSKRTKEIVKIIVDNEGECFDYNTLSAWTGYHASTIKKYRKELDILVKLGLLDKRRYRKKVIYYFKISGNSKNESLKKALKDIISSSI
jgi:hypothetical protein